MEFTEKQISSEEIQTSSLLDFTQNTLRDINCIIDVLCMHNV